MTEREEGYEVALMRIASLDIGWYDLEDAINIATKELNWQAKKLAEAKTTDEARRGSWRWVMGPGEPGFHVHCAKCDRPLLTQESERVNKHDTVGYKIPGIGYLCPVDCVKEAKTGQGQEPKAA